MKRKLLIMLILFFPLMINAEEIDISDTFQLNDFTLINKVVIDDDEEKIAVGIDVDKGYIRKYDKLSNLIWSSDYNKLSVSEFTDVVIDDENNIVTVGYASDEDSIFIQMIRKYDSNGNIIWEKENSEMSFNSIYFVNNGYVIVGNFKNNRNSFIIKYDKIGNIIWQSDYSGKFDNFEVINNEYIVLVNSSYVKNIDGCGNEDSFFIKYNDNGEIIWQSSSWTDEENEEEDTDDGWICQNDTIYDYRIDKNGEIKAVGTMGILTYNSDGSLKNIKLFSDDYYYRTLNKSNFHILNDGFLIINNEDPEKENYNIFIKKYDFNNELEWEEKKSFGESLRYYSIRNFDNETIAFFSNSNYFLITIEYEIKADDNNTNGTVNVIKTGKSGIVKPTPNEGYEVDKVIVKDKSGNVLDVEVTKQEDGTYSFELYTDVSVEVLFKEKLVNPKTGVSSFIGVMFTLMLIGISGFFMIRNCNNSYEL